MILLWYGKMYESVFLLLILQVFFFCCYSIVVECNNNILFLNIVEFFLFYFIFVQFGFVNVFFCLLALSCFRIIIFWLCYYFVAIRKLFWNIIEWNFFNCFFVQTFIWELIKLRYYIDYNNGFYLGIFFSFIDIFIFFVYWNFRKY